MNKFLSPLAALAALAAPAAMTVSAEAAVYPTYWNSVSDAEIGSELEYKSYKLGVIGVNSPSQGIDPSHDFTGDDFSYAPLAGVSALIYGYGNDLYVEFGDFVEGLLLYADFWRGGVTVNDDPAVSYEFNAPFEILSGFAAASVLGNTLALDDDDAEFHSGIIRFLKPVKILTIGSDADGGAAQSLTFALDSSFEDVSEVPVPAALPLFLAGMAGVGAAARRKRKA